jgi:phage shock protein PspC (stress-responsive transcriptional regulator)
MNKVIIVNLNGIAYQLEEPGYNRLRRYMDRAEARLGGNPDRAEILRDMEQAIGEKFAARLGAHKTVISSEEVDTVLKEVGMVDPGESGAESESSRSEDFKPGRKRLYRIMEGQKIAGVCTGLAAYADVNVSLVRWIFALLAIGTSGVFGLVYIAMIFLVPFAYTPEQRAEAHGSAVHID